MTKIQIRKTFGNPSKLGAKVYLFGCSIGRNCLVTGLTVSNSGWCLVTPRLHVSLYRVL